MTSLESMEQALGCPSAIVALPVSATETVTIGRWKHRDAEPKVGGDGLIKLIINLSNSQKVERLKHGIWTSKPFGIGSFAVIGPEEDVCFSVRGRADVLQIFLPQCTVSCDIDSAGSPKIRSRFQDQDPAIERCALQVMVAAEQRATTDDLRLSEMIARLANVLARDAQTPTLPIKGGLSPHCLRRVLDLVASSISAPEVKPVNLEQLAQVADLSPFHFARAFRQTVGLSPYGFVLRKRLERARAMLAKTSFSVADIGRRVGFRSHAHFSSQFRQQMGVSPASFRRAVRC